MAAKTRCLETFARNGMPESLVVASRRIFEMKLTADFGRLMMQQHPEEHSGEIVHQRFEKCRLIDYAG